ncbi:MAG: peptidoglycan-binding protein [Acidimicrobiales bacterium]
MATVLLPGTLPAWRDLSVGVTGVDVTQLNADLVALGDATAAELSPTSDVFSTATATAVKAMQANLGDPQTGILTFGQVVFLPTPLRVTAIAATIGSAATGGQVISGTSTTRQITFGLPAAQLTEIKVGDAVTVTLPDQSTTAGTVSSVGTTTNTDSPPAVTVEVAPTDPAATRTADQGTVSLAVTTGVESSILALPVAALSATTDGHPAVSVTGAGGTRLVPVTVGLFDDADGLIEVTGPGLSAGDQVVIPG